MNRDIGFWSDDNYGATILRVQVYGTTESPDSDSPRNVVLPLAIQVPILHFTMVSFDVQLCLFLLPFDKVFI